MCVAWAQTARARASAWSPLWNSGEQLYRIEACGSAYLLLAVVEDALCSTRVWEVPLYLKGFGWG